MKNTVHSTEAELFQPRSWDFVKEIHNDDLQRYHASCILVLFESPLVADMIYLSLIKAHWVQGVTTAIVKLKFVAFYLNYSKAIQLINPLQGKLYFCTSTIKIAFVPVL